jgi:hypothetical protein
VRADAIHFRGFEPRTVLAGRQPFRFHLLTETLDAHRFDEHLDARLVDVVAAAIAVINAQDRFQVGQQVRQRQEVTDHLPDDGLAAEATADENFEADLALRVAFQVEANIMDLGSRAVFGRAGDGDLEFTGQVGEFGVMRRPLPDDLAVRARVVDLVLRDASHVVGGDVANTIAARLDRMHLDGGQMLEDIGNILQLRPVELQILAGGEMTEAPVIAPGHVAKLAQLICAQEPIRDGDAEHRRVSLDVETVTQAYGLELVFGELAGEKTPRLVTELRDPLVHEGLIQLIVSVHSQRLYGSSAPTSNTVWLCRCGGRL